MIFDRRLGADGDELSMGRLTVVRAGVPDGVRDPRGRDRGLHADRAVVVGEAPVTGRGNGECTLVS